MKNQWVEFFNGKVTVRISGKGLERFLNVLTRNGLLIWNVRKHGADAAIFTMRLSDAMRIRKYARNSGCRITFIRRSGAPFLMKRLLKNSGFLIGIFMFLFLIMLLSNVVWGIEIEGAKPETEYQIRKELDKIGISIGKIQFFLDDVESIQRQLTDNIGAITWVGVELQGTTYHFRVVEKNQPKETELLTPRHLIAKKKAVIVNYYVTTGQKMVDINDHVVPGQLLVSGLIGREGENKPVAATGEIWGETLYTSSVELPLKSTFQVFNGNEKQKHFLRIGKMDLQIWGFGQIKFREYEIDSEVKRIKILKWKIPLSYVNKTFREREKITREYMNDEAIKMALSLAKKDIKHRLDEDAIVKGEKILQRSIVNGKVKLTILFQVIENIAIGQPIIQGDS